MNGHRKLSILHETKLIKSIHLRSISPEECNGNEPTLVL